MGFEADIKGKDDTDLSEILEMVQPEDLIKFGLIPEFTGRIPIAATLSELSMDALVRILTEPKNALIKQYKKLFAIDDVQLSFEEEALKAIAQKAIIRKTGARGLRSILEEIMVDIMYVLPEYGGYDVVITKEVVESGTKPVYIKQKAQTKAKKSA